MLRLARILQVRCRRKCQLSVNKMFTLSLSFIGITIARVLHLQRTPYAKQLLYLCPQQSAYDGTIRSAVVAFRVLRVRSCLQPAGQSLRSTNHRWLEAGGSPFSKCCSVAFAAAHLRFLRKALFVRAVEFVSRLFRLSVGPQHAPSRPKNSVVAQTKSVREPVRSDAT